MMDETDLDLGHYERLLMKNWTTVQILPVGRFLVVLLKKKEKENVCSTVQMISSYNKWNKNKVFEAANCNADIVITEIMEQLEI